MITVFRAQPCPTSRKVLNVTQNLPACPAFDQNCHIAVWLTTFRLARYESLAAFLAYITARCEADEPQLDVAHEIPRLDIKEFIRRGQERTIKITGSRPLDPCLPFLGREDAMRSLFEHATEVITATTDIGRSEIVFVHASPGVGKTRLFQEVVAMTIEERAALFSSSSQSPSSLSKEQLHEAVCSVLPIHITFHGLSKASSDLPLLYERPERGSLPLACMLRVIFTWLTNLEDYPLFVHEINREVSSAHSDQVLRLISPKSVLAEVRIRSGGKKPFLLVDEPLLYEEEHVTFLSAKNPAFTMALALKNLMELQDPPYQIPIAFSALKIGVFAQVHSANGRPIVAVPLRLLPIEEAKILLKRSLSQPMQPNGVGKTWLQQLSENMMKSPDEVVEVLAVLAGGHCRSMEILIDAVRKRLTGDKSSTLGAIIDDAKSRFALRYGFANTVGLNEAILMAQYNRSVSFGSKFIANLTDGAVETTVGDLIASGALMGSSCRGDSVAHGRVEEHLNLPLLSFLSWSSWMTSDSVRGGPFAKSLSEEVSRINNAIKLQGRSNFEAFELIYAHYTKILRFVYKEISTRGHALPLVGGETVDWTRASISDMFPSTWGEMKLSKSISQSRFDLTQPLLMKPLTDKEASSIARSLKNIDGLTDEAFLELTSTIFIPTADPSTQSLGHVLVLRDVDAFSRGERRVVVLAVENRHSMESSSTLINIDSDVYGKRNNARKLLSIDLELEADGKVSLMFVLNAWRGIKNTIELQENCAVLSKVELARVFGKPMVDFMIFMELSRPGCLGA
jgi:hypothetical protein